VYMRSTVLLLDTLVYVPALVLFMKAWQESRSKRTQVCTDQRVSPVLF
jgi:alpha-1,3-glucosyltransferase